MPKRGAKMMPLLYTIACGYPGVFGVRTPLVVSPESGTISPA